MMFIYVFLFGILAGISSRFKSRNIAICTRDTSGSCVLLLLNKDRKSLLNESYLVEPENSCEFCYSVLD